MLSQSFDNILSSTLTLFEILTTEGGHVGGAVLGEWLRLVRRNSKRFRLYAIYSTPFWAVSTEFGAVSAGFVAGRG